jgi:hypothetical protein
MKKKTILLGICIILIILLMPIFLLYFFQYITKAAPVRADIFVDTKHTVGPFPERWKAFAQGGEENGVQMLANVTSQMALLYPKYIRLDHIYDFYDVIHRDSSNNLSFNFDKLDKTVCDIYRTGAKPFFTLGYMPEVLSGDTSLVSQPRSWNEWSLTVQKTIEHYSGTTTRICGQVTGVFMSDIYYEVWNEPDLETFGKWSIYGGKDYKTLYFYSIVGAQKAQNVYPFKIGGPVTTKLYKNWLQTFLKYTATNNLRVDFISWHHYSQHLEDYISDIRNIDGWLADPIYAPYRTIPRIISEWGFDSDYNADADTSKGAAHTTAALRNFLDEKIDFAFLFEIKDGKNLSWGILTHDGEEKPRYKALKLLYSLTGQRIDIEGEGTFVTGMASTIPNKTTLILTNYDEQGRDNELVPVTFANVENGIYTLTVTYLDGRILTTKDITPLNNQIKQNVLMTANSIALIELVK